MSLKDDFVERALGELNKEDIKYVRIHASGDFYSEEYVDKWYDIVKAKPSILFLAYTKTRRLKESLLKLASLPNMSLFESLDNTRTKSSLGVKIATSTNRELKDHHTCPGHCPSCKFVCWSTEDNIKFKPH